MPLFPSSRSQISLLSSPLPAWKRKRRKQPSSKAQDEAELPTTTAGVRARPAGRQGIVGAHLFGKPREQCGIPQTQQACR